ncbi:hypothetical protein EIK77_007640 [Talaromyces pinophilus]|nr:hypothetical protein EIK77_007640 [Talaromyces pinophilus]
MPPSVGQCEAECGACVCFDLGEAWKFGWRHLDCPDSCSLDRVLGVADGDTRSYPQLELHQEGGISSFDTTIPTYGISGPRIELSDGTSDSDSNSSSEFDEFPEVDLGEEKHGNEHGGEDKSEDESEDESEDDDDDEAEEQSENDE